jgi:hypothetical protein
MGKTKESWWVMTEYASYTMQYLLDTVAANKYRDEGLDAHADRCALEILKRHQEEIEYEQL